MSTINKPRPNYNCLFRIPNDETNRAIIAEVRKMMKDYGTKWQLVVRGRKPKPGTGPYPYGSVPLKNAQELGIYIYLKPSIQKEQDKARWDYIKRINKQAKDEVVELEDKLSRLVGLVYRLQASKNDLAKFVNKYTGTILLDG
tara:strand:- start:1646 stop:2074 length:429 start_codon:yes stop_codon:yes gene_type:complete